MQHVGSSPNSDQIKAPYRPSCTLHYWTTSKVTEIIF